MARSNLGKGSELLAAATKKRIRFPVAGGGSQEACMCQEAHVRCAACGQEEDQLWSGL